MFVCVCALVLAHVHEGGKGKGNHLVKNIMTLAGVIRSCISLEKLVCHVRI